MAYKHTFDEMSEEQVQIAGMKTLIGLCIALFTVFFGILLFAVDWPIVGGFAYLVAISMTITALGRQKGSVRYIAELQPWVDYDFPPLEQYDRTGR